MLGNLKGIEDDYYQEKGGFGLIYDKSDDVNLPPLPPESPAYTTNIPCIHSNIPDNGEILSLPLISLVYRVKQSDEVKTLIEEVNEEYLF